MRLLFIRHGDPNYEIDSLTPKGWNEAEALSRYMESQKVDEFYVSPLGRAQDTANVTLKHLNRNATTLDWLREFPAGIHRPDLKKNEIHCPWDWMPGDWTVEPKYYDANAWYTTDIMQEGHVKEVYDHVIQNFRELLKQHGYQKEGNVYKVTHSNHDTLCFYCHFGIECVLLSDLFSISPMILWHSTVALPTSVTSVITEERREGIASFRMNYFGSTTHLYVDRQEPSFAARYAECFEDKDLH